MKKFLIIAVLIIVLASIGGVLFKRSRENVTFKLTEKIYVAVENKGAVAIVDPISRKTLKYIDLSMIHDGESLMYMPTDIELSSDGSAVWVSANAMEEGMDHTFHLISPRKVSAHGSDTPFDDVIVIDPLTDTVKARISVAPAVHLSSLSFTADKSQMQVNADKTQRTYLINTKTFLIDSNRAGTEAASPSLSAVSPDGSLHYAVTPTSTNVFVTDAVTRADIAKIFVGIGLKGLVYWHK